jgi:methyl coenzyme M reductase subunit C-like uncharacterized protein (methanogenesis marker protein 7)
LPGGIREKRAVDEQIRQVGVALRLRVGLDDLDIAKAQPSCAASHRRTAGRQDFNGTETARRDAGAVEHHMAVAGADIAKNLVLARRHGAEDFAELTKRRAAERQMLVAEATQQAGQARELLTGIGLDVQRVCQHGVFNVAVAGVKFADECA